MKHHYVSEVFGEATSLPSCLLKIDDYHDETGNSILFSIRLKPKPECPKELKHLHTMKSRVGSYHLDMIKKYLPMSALENARQTYFKNQYYKSKHQETFLRNAIQQILDYDPFFLTIDDIHNIEMIQLKITYKRIYYEEKLKMSLSSPTYQ